MPNPFFDNKLVTYLKRKAAAGRTVSASELVDFCLAHRSNLCRDGEEALPKATALVEDFLARRSLVAQLANQIEQIQSKKQDAERDTLIASLHRFARNNRRRTWLYAATVWGMLCLYLLWISQTPNRDLHEWDACFFVVWFIVTMLHREIVDYLTGKWREVERMKTLIKYGGARTVGLLAEAWTMREITNQAEDALLRELPRLKASDATLITTAQRNCLYIALKQSSTIRAFSWFKGPNQALPLAILKALEQIGDEKAIPHVEWVAAGNGNGLIAAVQQAAEACLPFLRERVAQRAISQTLLRPSSAAEAISATPDTLLRPAQYASATEPEQLLRASAGQRVKE